MGHHQATRDGRRVEGKTEGGVMCRGGLQGAAAPIGQPDAAPHASEILFLLAPTPARPFLEKNPDLGCQKSFGEPLAK